MPSVRVKRPNSSTQSSGEEARPLSTIFAANTARPTSSGDPETSASPREPGSPQDTSLSRRRGRGISRITRQVQRNSDFLRLDENEPRDRRSRVSIDSQPRSLTRLSVQDGVLGGSQVDVQMRQGPEPGLIDSALSLHSAGADDTHHHDDIVEHLDVIDPQVYTVSNLTNAANSILIPPLSFYSRKPVVVLPSAPLETVDEEKEMPSGEYEDDLDRHVGDVLKRPSKFKRTMKGVWSFLKTPMGVFVFIYGFNVVFWGAAIVFFLAKIINLHNANTQGFWVEISSQVVNGLFTATGVGLIPFRAMDTYRIFKIWRYKRRTRVLRAKAGLPPLYDEDDLPDPAYDPNYIHVLTEKEQKDLHRQQVKFQYSQTWYRPHGTETHRAFPIGTALLICSLNDLNSVFQIMLCGVMWGLNRFQRPAWTTGCLIPLGFICGISSAICIWRGGQKTKRTKKVEAILRQALEMERTTIAGSTVVRPSATPAAHSNGSSGTNKVSAEKAKGPRIVVDGEQTVPANVTPQG